MAPHHRLDVGQRRQVRTSTDEKIKWWRAPKCKRDLVVPLGATALDIDPNQPVEATWNNIANQIREASWGRASQEKRFIDKQIWWWNPEVQISMKEKKSALNKWHQSRHDMDYKRHKILKAKAKKAVAKAAHYNQLYHDLDTPGGANKIYRLVNSWHRSTQAIVRCNTSKIRISKSCATRPPSSIAGASNQEFPHPPILSAVPIHGPEPPNTPAEVKDAIKKMKNGKAPGPDNIPAEAWKLLGSRGALPSTHYSMLSPRKANPQRPGAPESQSQSGKPKATWPTAPTTTQYASCAML